MLVLVPSFFSCKWIPNLLARADTHTQKLAKQTLAAADKKNTLECEEEQEGAWKKKLSEAPGIRTHDRNHFMLFILLFHKSYIFHISVTSKVLFFFFSFFF